MAKKKYYVVWAGRKTGIYTTWDECKAQVHGFQGARYKSFPTLEEAESAFKAGGGSPAKNASKSTSKSTSSSYIEESICVDAACSGNPGIMEYQGVDTKMEERIFHYGPVKNGTNNIGEFLAIVHALSLFQKEGKSTPIYTDSITALAWVRNKKVNTNLPRSEETQHIWERIDKSIEWLNHHSYENPIMKWETKKWGEIKADFGRK
ncbi:ribonuclease H1 domain-containing protein [Priestia endophytica]